MLLLTVLSRPTSRWVCAGVRPVTALRACWWDRAFSAQRLDLEGKHADLLCDSGKSRTLVKHKRLIFTERAVTQSVLCVICGVNAVVKYPGRFSRWLQRRLSHHWRVLSDSQVLCIDMRAVLCRRLHKSKGVKHLCLHCTSDSCRVWSRVPARH